MAFAVKPPMLWGGLGLLLALVAGVLFFRYTVVPLNMVTFARLDRLSGSVELCSWGNNSPLHCLPAPINVPEPNPYMESLNDPKGAAAKP